MPPRERLLRKGDYVYGSFLKPEHVDGYINAVNPGDRTDILGRFPFSASSVDDAIESAQRGARVWRRVSLSDRASALRRFREGIAHFQETLARLLTRENGKPLWEARQEVSAAVRTLDLFLDEGIGLLSPRTIEEIAARTDFIPRGVVAVVCPYNLPLLIGATMSAAAVLGGNAVVMKPSKFTPGTGQFIAELWDRCKLPRGVFNLVQGSGSVIGARLVAHAGIDALLFTGCYESAREVRRATLERPELPVLYQTGGKGLALVLDDAAIDRTVYEVLVGACLTTGQRHNSTARVIVTDRVFDAFSSELARRAERLKVGYGLETDAFMGPVISENLRARYRKYGKAVVAKGHTALLEPQAIEIEGFRGNYVRPGVIQIHWEKGSPFLNDEPPGPLALLYRVRDWEQAVELHNQAVYRLAASVFTDQANAALPEIRDTIRTGALNVNRSTIGASLRLPSMGLGRASNGLAGGIDLLRVVTYPRASLTETREFDPSNLVPGVAWSDTVDAEEEPDLGGALELAVE